MVNDVLKRRDAVYVLPLAGSRIERCCVSTGLVALEFEGYEFTPVVSLWQTFVVTRWKQEWRLEPSESESLLPALALVGVTAVDATVSEQGALELLFPEGSLRVAPASGGDHAGWEFRRGDGLRVGCAAAVGLTISSPGDAARRDRVRKDRRGSAGQFRGK